MIERIEQDISNSKTSINNKELQIKALEDENTALEGTM